MWKLIKAVTYFARKRDSESAAALLVVIADWLNDGHLSDMSQYLSTLKEIRRARRGGV